MNNMTTGIFGKLLISVCSTDLWLIIPIVIAAAFMVYRHIKESWGGSGACHNCPSRHACCMNPKNAAEPSCQENE